MEYPSNILIADDEAIAAMSLRLELKRAGFPTCQIVATGENAVSAALQESFDAILMDVHLAGKINGLEAARQIRAAGFDTPIIFISGYADQEHREQTA
jgi:CheY-like chemotaxis protein